MARTITLSIPHDLGAAEARRRIESGFGAIQQQLAGGLAGLVAFETRWEGDRLHFEGGSLGQQIVGHLDVFVDAVRMQIELPPLLAVITDRLAGRLKKETQKLLER
jgi:hypothetical protein